MFTHFIDRLDMTMCCGSDISGEELNHTTSREGLYFPLIQDEERSLREHVRAMEYTSRSARYGPFVDNIVGMNWILPSGKRIKVGERVVKSTTGYDLFKFLLTTDGRFGHPSDYVIRLRPSCPATYGGIFTGDKESLKVVYQTLRNSSWNHWVDEIDLVVSANRAPRIEVAINCQISEKDYFSNFFRGVASRAGSAFEEAPLNINKHLPWLTIKCLPSAAFGIAEDLVRNSGGLCRVLLMNGVVLIHPEHQIPARQMVLKMRPGLEDQGGHIYGNGLDKEKVSGEDMEGGWVANLLKSWETL